MKTNQITVTDDPLTPELLGKMNAYWRAANYLSVGQIYLYDNPLIREPLKLSHVKPTLLGRLGDGPADGWLREEGLLRLWNSIACASTAFVFSPQRL